MSSVLFFLNPPPKKKKDPEKKTLIYPEEHVPTNTRSTRQDTQNKVKCVCNYVSGNKDQYVPKSRGKMDASTTTGAI